MGLTAVGVTSYTVVPATTVSVATEVVLSRAGQLVTVEGQAVTVTVRVEKKVSVVYWYPPPFPGATGEPVMIEPPGWAVVVASTGQMVVETRIVSVVTYVLRAGQSVTVAAQAVIVDVRVVNTVEVVS